MIKEALKKYSDKNIDEIFPRITYKDSMLKYGNDKPDLRFALEIQDVTDILEILVLLFLQNRLKMDL